MPEPETNVVDPWRCRLCEKLIYNIDENGYPRPGAPLPLWGGIKFSQVCSLCFEMQSALNTEKNSGYWGANGFVYRLKPDSSAIKAR
jgi:hypothetical protein